MNPNKDSRKELKNSEDLDKKERKILRTKDFILNAAKELFSRKSYNSITMEEIADLAALSRATLYNYFNTKEELYFNIGILKLEQWIEQYKSKNFSKYSGEQLILMLTENLVKDLLEFPFYSKLLRRFFNRSEELDLPIQEFFYKRFIKNIKIQDTSIFLPQNKVFHDLLECYAEYRQLWQNGLEIGIKDGSIKSPSNPNHLNFIIIMIIFGLLDQIDFRRSLMDMVNLSNEEILQFILNLTKKLLKGEI